MHFLKKRNRTATLHKTHFGRPRIRLAMRDPVLRLVMVLDNLQQGKHMELSNGQDASPRDIEPWDSSKR